MYQATQILIDTTKSLHVLLISIKENIEANAGALDIMRFAKGSARMLGQLKKVS